MKYIYVVESAKGKKWVGGEKFFSKKEANSFADYLSSGRYPIKARVVRYVREEK